MADLPQVDVVTRPEGDHLDGPSTNVGLQLAQSLAGVNQELPGFLGQLGAQLKARQEDAAYKAAMANSGQAFGDAVRPGKLAPTQNPWFIQAYERQSAQVRAQGQVSGLVADSQSWAERNDPQAFAAKFNQQLGQIAQGFTGVDQTEGFKSAAAPLADEALTQNLAYNVQRIQAEHVQDTTTLMTKAVMDTLRANPNAAPADIFAAMEPVRQKWLAVGGTDATANALMTNSVIGAAANLGNPDLIDVLKDPRGGRGALADIAGPDGKPIGSQMVQEKELIERQVIEQGAAAIASVKNATQVEGLRAVTTASQHFGSALYNGSVDPQTLQTFLVNSGVSPQGAAFAIGQISDDVSHFDSLNRASMDIHSTDPTKANGVLSLWSEGASKGWSPDYEDRVSQAVLSHQIGLPDAEQMIVRAHDTSRQIAAEGRAEVHAERAEATAGRSLRLQETHDIMDWAKTSADTTGAALQASLGDTSLLGNTPARIVTERAAIGAATEAYRKTGSVQSANEAADAVYSAFVARRIAAHKQLQQQTGAGGSAAVNPLRPHQ